MRFCLNAISKNVIVFATCLALTTVFSGCKPDEADLPQKPIIKGATSNTCSEATVTLSTSSIGSVYYLWKKDGTAIKGQTKATLVVSESGTYTVAGVNEDGTGMFSDPHKVTIIIFPPPKAEFTYKDDLDFFTLTSTSKGDIADYQWKISRNPEVRILNPKANSTALELPSVATTVDVSLTVTNIGGSSTVTQSIELPPLTFYRKYGLGRDFFKEVSNNVDYEWYLDQKNTGRFWNSNCGPTCVTMAIKWTNRDFAKTPEDARSAYHPEGGWWYTNNITDYLKDNNTAHFVSSLTHVNNLINQLDNGNIVILCLDMYYVRMRLEQPEWRIDKFYLAETKGWGHFIVVKGYKMVDDIVWFEVYDPWSQGIAYNDGTLKGLDRYYRGDEILQATNVWWEYMIVINNPANPSVSLQAIDPSTIVHRRGR